MKILFWTSGFWPAIGGAETFGFSLTKALQDKGHKCHVVAQQLQGVPATEIYKGININRYSFDTIYHSRDLSSMLKILEQLKLLVEKFSPDIIHLQLLCQEYLMFFKLFQKKFDIPILLTVHGGSATLASTHNHKVYNYLKQLKWDWINSVSEFCLEQIRLSVPFVTSKSSLIYNGILVPDIEPERIPQDPVRLLCLGRLSEEKGFNLAIEAFAKINNKFDEIELVIAGDGTERNALEKLTEKYNLQEKIKFIGVVPSEHVYELINTATIVLMPSRYEPFGLTAIEAGLMGRPVIASRVGGLIEVICDKETGLLVEPNNSDLIAKAIEYLYLNRDELARMGMNAREFIIKNFNLDKMVMQYENLYHQVIKLKANAT